MKKVLLFRGSPASGKTTIARKVAARIGAKRIETDAIKSMFGDFAKIEWKRVIKDSLLTYQCSALLLNHLLEQEKNIVIEGLFLTRPPIKELERIAKKHSALFYVFSLTADESVLLSRDKTRRFSVKGGKKALRTLMKHANKLDDKNWIQINSTELSPDEIVRLVLRESGF